VRVYEATPPIEDSLRPSSGRASWGAAASILAPVPQKSLQATLARMLRPLPGRIGKRARAARGLFRSGELENEHRGLSYAWPAGAPVEVEAPRQVRLLAPFIRWSGIACARALLGMGLPLRSYTRWPSGSGYYALPCCGAIRYRLANASLVDGRWTWSSGSYAPGAILLFAASSTSSCKPRSFLR